MKPIYSAPNKQAAEAELTTFELKWGTKYHYAIRSWRINWDDLKVGVRVYSPFRLKPIGLRGSSSFSMNLLR